MRDVCISDPSGQSCPEKDPRSMMYVDVCVSQTSVNKRVVLREIQEV